MKIEVKHIQKRGIAGWRYRRKIPKELRAAAGKLEILIPLGSTEQQALKAYPRAHAQAEQHLRQWSRPQSPASSSGTLSPTEFEQFRLSRARLRALSLDPEWSGPDHEDDPEALARELIAEQIADKYPVDERGHPVGIGTEDRALIHALVLGERQQRPDPTLEDAKRLYLKERVGEDETKQMELERVFKLVKEAMGKDRKLTSLKREDARARLAANGKGLVIDPNEKDQWMEQLADRYADELTKKFSTKLALNPEVAAMALASYFGRKLPEVYGFLREHLSEDDRAAMEVDNDEF